jgi:hypothetical protein
MGRDPEKTRGPIRPKKTGRLVWFRSNRWTQKRVLRLSGEKAMKKI